MTNPSDRALRDLGKVDVASLDQYTPGQQLMAASLPVVIASNQSAVPVSGTFWQATQPVSGTFWQATQPVSGTVTATQATATSLRVAGGDAAGTPTAGTVLAVQGIASGTALPVSGTFWQATQPVSGTVTAISGTAVNLKAEVVGTGTFAVQSAATLAAETTKVIGTVRALGNAGAIFDAATGAAVPANALFNGARAATANPTSATGGNMVGIMADKAGRLVTTIGHTRDLVGVQTTNITTTAETTIVTAGGAGVFNDISSLVITNRTATACFVTLKDDTAGTTRAIYDLAANGGLAIDFNPPMPQAVAAKPWTLTLSAGSITVDCNVVFVKNL